jgi:hypothetical protein
MYAVCMKNSPTSIGVTTPGRWSQCFWVTKIVAALLRKPPPMKSKPVNATTSSFTGLLFRISTTSLTTLSVRCSVAPSGRITAEMKNPWSSSGTSEPGVMRHRPAAIATMPIKSSAPITPRRIIQITPPT